MQPLDDDIIKAIRIASLIEASREGRDLNEADALEIKEWMERNPRQYNELGDRQLLMAQLEELDAFKDDDRIEKIISSVFVQQDGEVRSFPGKLNIKVWLRYAAVLVPVIAISVAYLWNSSSSNRDRNVGEAQQSLVAPAKERAILTLNDGRSIEIDDRSYGEIAREGSAVITRASDGWVTYANNGVNSAQVYVNTIATPKGAYLQLRLPDGSGVWLNAASSIRFPARFSDSIRKVEVTGEAYFEVVHNTKAPFHVNLPHNIDLQVLGTHFIVESYESDDHIDATLLEGAVRVWSSKSNAPSQSVVLVPEERARYAPQKGSFAVSKIDTSIALTWMKGVFNFGVQPLSETLSEIERWYDVDIEYQSAVPNIQLWGTIDRQMNFEKLLEFLGRSGLKYNRIGPRKIIVLPGTHH